MSTPPAPKLILGTSGGKPVVLLPDGTEFTTLAPLLAALPGLLDPADAAWLAQAVNQLAHGIDYEVILDPAAFETASRARLAAEDPAEPWREGVQRLGDYGVPDFAAIKAPQRVGEGLQFFAVERQIGLPYRVDLPSLRQPPVYDPVRLTPLPRPASAAPAGELTRPDDRPAAQTVTLPPELDMP